MTIETKEYAINPSLLIKKITQRQLSSRAPLIFIIVALTLACACWDSRFVFIALIEIFILVPFLTINVWLFSGTKPSVAKSTIPHKALINEDGITLKYFPPEGIASIANLHISFNDIKKIIVDKAFFCIILGKKADQIELIPLNAFEDSEDVKRFVETIRFRFEDK